MKSKNCFIALSNTILLLVLFGATSIANAQLCSQASDLPAALKNTIDIVGALPEDDLPKIVAKMKIIGDGASTIADLNILCGIVKDKDWVNGYLYALPQIATMTGTVVAPFVSVLAELAGKEVEAIKNIAKIISLGRITGDADQTIQSKFSLSLDKFAWWGLYNQNLSPQEISNHVVSINLVFGNQDRAPILFDLNMCTFDKSVPCTANRLTTKLSGTAINTMPGDEYNMYVRVAFKNKQWFLIPLASNYITTLNLADGSEFTVPFLLKNGKYYYNR